MNHNSITTEVRPNLSIPSCPQVRIGVFDANRHGWKQLAPYWLRKMAADGFECHQRHTLSISGGAQAEIIILVCEQVANPTTHNYAKN